MLDFNSGVSRGVTDSVNFSVTQYIRGINNQRPIFNRHIEALQPGGYFEDGTFHRIIVKIHQLYVCVGCFEYNFACFKLKPLKGLNYLLIRRPHMNGLAILLGLYPYISVYAELYLFIMYQVDEPLLIDDRCLSNLCRGTELILVRVRRVVRRTRGFEGFIGRNGSIMVLRCDRLSNRNPLKSADDKKATCSEHNEFLR